MDTMNSSSNTEAVTKQLIINRDMHLKELIDLKQSHNTTISKLENKIDILKKNK